MMRKLITYHNNTFKKTLIKKLMKKSFLKNLVNASLLITTLFYPMKTKETGNFKKPGLEKKVIVLDPGHGNGNAAFNKMDYGTAHYKTYKEADLVLKQAKITKELLEKTNKYVVYLTREDNNKQILCEERPEFSNRLNADLFVSLHLNNFRKSYVKGFEIFYRNNILMLTWSK